MARDLLSEAITEPLLLRLAGSADFQRGRDYFANKHVISVEPAGDSVVVTVRDAQPYAVELSAEDGILDYSCGCPAGVEGSFCKHCVAAALACKARSSKAKPRRKGRPKKTTLADVKKLLHSLEKDAVIGLVMEAAREIPDLGQRLTLLAAASDDAGINLPAFKDLLRKKLTQRELRRYRYLGSAIRRGFDELVDLGELIEQGHAYTVIELAEYALHVLGQRMGGADDLSHELEELRDHLETIHHRACLDARPDPVALGVRLFEMEFGAKFEIFTNSVSRYAEPLGVEGVAAYRDRAARECAGLPPETTYWDLSRLAGIMETIAIDSGDPSGFVELVSRDVRSSEQYLRIAEVCRKTRRYDDALHWAERGLKEPRYPNHRIGDFLAAEYQRRGRHNDAIALRWEEFRKHDGIGYYRALRDQALEADLWGEWRERAIAAIRADIEKEKKDYAERPEWDHWGDDVDHSRLVDVFILEGDLAAARREAEQGGCQQDVWLRLAAALETDAPDEAAAIYFSQAKSSIEATYGGKYGPAVAILTRAAAFFRRRERYSEFARYIDGLRIQYKTRRNLIKELDENQDRL
jgi:uncharacterized Zn finger protein